MMDALVASTSADIADFITPRVIREYDEPPSALRFLKECVAPHLPCLIKEGYLTSEAWRDCATKWDFDYFGTNPLVASKVVNVNATPDGRADAVKQTDINNSSERVFTTPCEVKMKMGDFIKSLGRGLIEGDDEAVLYLSEQNDNLRRHFEDSLFLDIPRDIALAREAFAADCEGGGSCDEAFASGSLTAINLWIGDERSETSLHKDFYENLYFVIKGCKTFDLLPPAAILSMNYQRFRCQRYVLSSSSGDGVFNCAPRARDLSLRDGGENVEWLDEQQGNANGPSSPVLRVHVREGQMLYVPAMWLHRVAQTEPTIAVNYWYEQAFDHRYVLYNVCRKVGELAVKSAAV